MRYATVGTEFVAAVAMMAVIGYLVDQWLGCLPWCTVAGTLLGFAAGVYRLAKAGKQLQQEQKDSRTGGSSPHREDSHRDDDREDEP